MSEDAGGHFRPSLEGLAQRHMLDERAVARLRLLAAMLVGDALAPTSVRDAVRVRDDHLADALVALELPEVRGARVVADIGAGAGVPGLPLAAALPNATVFLVEASARKCAFMTRAAEVMDLSNVTIVQSRIEAWRGGLGRQDLVTARALAPLDVLMEYAAPLLRVGGALVAWRGAREPEGEAAGDRAAALLGLQVREPIPVKPYELARERHLHVIRKVGPTPERFPRRDGVARKRPLGHV